jgi:hypothetical protein
MTPLIFLVLIIPLFSVAICIVTLNFENKRLHKAYKDALEQWADCIHLARSLHEENERLRNLDGEGWKNAD